MGDYVTLLGAEQVQNAANTMRSAAETIANTAREMGYSVDRLERILVEHAERIENAVEKKEVEHGN